MPNSHTRRRTKSCETRCAFPPRASCATCKSPTVKPVIPNQKLFNRPANAPRPRKSLPSPLSAFLEDGLGRTMTPQQGNKGSRRYRYYVSKHDAAQAESCSRIPASDLEAMVQQGLTKLLGDPLRLSAELGEGLIANEALAPSRSEEHTSELQSLMRNSYAVFCLKKKNTNPRRTYKTKNLISLQP